MDDRLFGSLEWRCMDRTAVGGVWRWPGIRRSSAPSISVGRGRRWKTTNAGSHWLTSLTVTSRLRGRRDCRLRLDPNVRVCRHRRSVHPQQRFSRRWRHRSDDAGRSWATSALPDAAYQPRGHPSTNPDIVYVAALGHAWGPNSERGIYRPRTAGAPGPRSEKESQRRARRPEHGLPQPARPVRALWQGRRSRTPPKAVGKDSGLWRSIRRWRY